SMIPLPPYSTLFPYTTLFRSEWFFDENFSTGHEVEERIFSLWQNKIPLKEVEENDENKIRLKLKKEIESIFSDYTKSIDEGHKQDRKSTRLNSSHVKISYAVF